MTEKITAADAIRLLDAHEATAVDVREPDEFAVDHIPGAKLLPLSQVLIAAGLGSRAKLFIAQMQDWLDLGADCRMNTPGTTEGNWTWRLLPGEADDALAGRIFRLTDAAGRVSS